jgi:hypothetical protein
MSATKTFTCPLPSIRESPLSTHPVSSSAHTVSFSAQPVHAERRSQTSPPIPSRTLRLLRAIGRLGANVPRPALRYCQLLVCLVLGVRIFVCGYIPLAPASCLSGVINCPTPGSATTCPFSATTVPRSIVITGPPLTRHQAKGVHPALDTISSFSRTCSFSASTSTKSASDQGGPRYATSGRSGGEQAR